MQANQKKIVAASIVGLLVVGAVISGVFYFAKGKEEKFKYNPTVALPADYMIFVEQPVTEKQMAFVAALSCLAVHEASPGAPLYHAMFILKDGKLSDHQLATIASLSNKDVPKLVFASGGIAPEGLGAQVPIDEKLVFDTKGKSLARFFSFTDFISVGNYREALWVSPLANLENKVMILDQPTFPTQESVWVELDKKGVPSDIIEVINPYDVDTELMMNKTPGYYTDNYNGNPSYAYQDSLFNIQGLGCIGAEYAAYHHAYVITDVQPSRTDLGYMDLELNQRAIGTYEAIKNVSAMFGVPQYVVLVGSAAAVPQFQLPDETSSDPASVEGDKLVSSDSAYGFMDDDMSTMDAAVGRLVNLDLQGLSDQMVRTWLFENIGREVTVQYTDGPKTVDWSKHGSSFSGYQITYQRRQATPARFICNDYEDEGMEYEYCGPIGYEGPLGNFWPDPFIERTDIADMNNVLQASGIVAYRGHGSETGSLYMLPVQWGDEDAVLRGEEVRGLYLPPQVGMFVACMNAKIHGGGWNSRPDPVIMEKLFCTNYEYAGCVAYAGATEVSFSNAGQDSDAAAGEVNGNHKWDLNDAMYAFFFDGILDHEGDQGTLGNALMWSINRYINNPNHDFTVTPFNGDPNQADWSNLGAHWKTVAMYVAYGDPTFNVWSYNPGAGSYDPWHNGDGDQ